MRSETFLEAPRVDQAFQALAASKDMSHSTRPRPNRDWDSQSCL